MYARDVGISQEKGREPKSEAKGKGDREKGKGKKRG